MDQDIVYKTDYHVHSLFSPDGHDRLEALYWRAHALGYDTIAITDHVEWHGEWSSWFDAPAYLAELEAVRDKFGKRGLVVLSGVELGNPHDHSDAARRFLDQYPFDVRVASLHWLYGRNIHLSTGFAGQDRQEVYGDYFVNLGRLVHDFGPIDILAHSDRMLWRGT